MPSDFFGSPEAKPPAPAQRELSPVLPATRETLNSYSSGAVAPKIAKQIFSCLYILDVVTDFFLADQLEDWRTQPKRR